jgi:hypothetical protein
MFAEVSATRGLSGYLIPQGPSSEASSILATPKLQRAIGVIYRPETERISHYYHADVPRQFDAVIHIDTTSALRGLEPGEQWERGVEEPPETFPSGI